MQLRRSALVLSCVFFSSATAAADDGSGPDEVRVVGKKDPKPAIEQRLTRDEIRTVPGAFGDPFRAIDISPGLVPIISGLPYFFVRGAPPSSVGYFVDEVRVPYLFHFALGPGVIAPAIVEDVSLQPAAYSPRYGRFTGGVITATTRDAPTELRGEGLVRVFDAGAYVEKPLTDNGRVSVGVGGRYSYTAGLLSLVLPDTTIDYRDYNARAIVRLNDRWTATAFTFGSYDYASEIRNRRENVFLASEFHRLDLRADRRGSDASTTRIAGTVGFDRTRIEGTRFAQDILVGLRARHRWPVSAKTDVEIGGDINIDNYRGDIPNEWAVSIEDYEQARTLFASRVDTASGLWTSATYHPNPGWDLTATLRGDFFTSAGKSELGPSPRASTRVPLPIFTKQRAAFVAALGVMPQAPAYGIPIPAVGFRGLPGGLSYAFQKSAGFETNLPLRLKLRAVGVHHTYDGLRDFARENVMIPTAQQTSPSQAFGVELFINGRVHERVSTFGSATISRSQLGSTEVDRVRASPFDRTHVLQAGVLVDLGRGWRTSSRVLTYRGWLQSSQPTTDSRIPQNSIGQRSDDRLPNFFRVDVRIEKRWTLGNNHWIAMVIEGLNVTATKEVISRACYDPGQRGPNDPGGCIDEGIGPIVVPSSGVEAGL